MRHVGPVTKCNNDDNNNNNIIIILGTLIVTG